MSMDIFVFFVMTMTHFDIITKATILLLISAGYLVSKAIIFRDVMSMIDLVVAFYLIIMIFGAHTFFYYFIAAWFLYKLSLTLMAST